MKKSLPLAVTILFALTPLLSLRAEQVVIREIMYHPPDGLYEFVELENITSTVQDIAKWKLRGGVEFDFPDFDASDRYGTFLLARQRAIICETDPATFRAAYGLSSSVRVLGPWTGRLQNRGERITIEDKNGTTACTVRYGDSHPWPAGPDGTGHTLVLADHNRTIDDYRLWKTSASPRGTPGSSEPSNVVETELAINEVHFDALGNIEWVEIYNGGTASINTAGLFLSSQRDFSDKTPLGATIAGGEFASVNSYFETNGNSRVLYVIDSTDVVLTAVAFDRVSGRDYCAAYPDGSTDFYSSVTGTRDGPNDPTRESDVVITELMVEPPSGHRDGEFIELYNKGTSPVDLSGWRFVSGVDYRFSAGTTIGAGEYVVIAANQRFTSESHPSVSVLGEYAGNLNNNNELLRLEDSWGNLADEVHYHTGGDWPRLAAGQGSSLELRNPAMDNSKSSAWADSDEFNKSTFQTFRFADTFEQLRTMGGETSWKELHIHGVGDAHLALRNMSLKVSGSDRNLLPNDGQIVSMDGTGAQGWLCQGTHHLSHMEGREFHVVSTGHGDVRANRCEIDVLGIADNKTLAWRCEARWISGKPTLIVQTWDHSFGGILRLPIPRNLGTPGAPNSARLADAVPTVSELKHSPAVPTASEPVLVTVRVESATGDPHVKLYHRRDFASRTTEPVWRPKTMYDDGVQGGDLVAGDGIYSAVLDQHQIDDAIVQFYVEATNAGGSTVIPRPAPEKPALYVVDNSTTPLDLRTQRFVISATHADALTTGIGQSATFNFAFPRLSNQFFNCTFIGDENEIIYNCEIRKAGSPWQRLDSFALNQTTGKTGKWKTPGDKRYRGWSRRGMDDDPSQGRPYNNRITRYWLYLLGHPANENEFVRVIINGSNPILREDVETVSNDFLQRNWDSGENGELYRIDDAWWFDDGWGRTPQDASWVYKNTDEPERYHREWMKRSREDEYDYSSFINWVSSVGRNDFTEEEIRRMADIDMMAANAAVRGWIQDWDTLTLARGKNGYFYRRFSDGKWMLMQWDSDLTFGDPTRAFIGNLTGIRTFYDKVYVRQRFNYYLGELLDKYTDGSRRLETWLNLEERASTAYSSNASKFNSWNSNRRNRAIQELGTAWSTVFEVTSGNGTSLTTADDTISLTGSSGYQVYSIRVADHPEASVRLLRQTAWRLDDIQLRKGTNRFTVEAVDAQGNVVETDTFTVTKTGNALPVIDITPSPSSLHVSMQDTLVLDATASYDPEGTALSFEWSVDNQIGTDLVNPTADTAVVSFNAPGLYTIEVTVTDGEGQARTVTREAAVFAESGWSPFTTPILEDWWTAENIEVRNDYSGSAWYTLDDQPGKLTLKINGDRAKQLTASNPRHPILWRSVPETGDCILQTDMRLASVQRGEFISGLIIKALENGIDTSYVLAMDKGNALRVMRSESRGFTELISIFWDKGDAVIRIRRVGSRLYFDYREKPGVWTTVLALALPAGTTLGDGGIFAATYLPQAAVFEFDYVMVVDPGVTTPALESLRITELMYHPVGGSALEFIELTDVGTSVLNLAGVRFETGQPFGEFIFGDIELDPGESAVLVADQTAFHAEYGGAIRVLGEWTGGSLNDGGERVILSDPLGNAVHDFSYDDLAPWPLEADGLGPSLEVIDTEGDYADAANWRASLLNGGTPGVVEGGDSDGDGLSDSAEIVAGTDIWNPDTDGDGSLDGTEVAAGTNPLDASSIFRIINILRLGGGTLASWSAVPGRVYTLQASPDLTEASWTDVPGATAITAIGTFLARTDTGDPDAPQRYYRVVVD